MNPEETSAETKKPSSSLFRFGIRTALILITLAAAASAWVSHARHQTLASQRVLQKLSSYPECEVREYYTYQVAESGQGLGPGAEPPAIPTWKRWIYGDKLGHDLFNLAISFNPCESIEFLEELTKLRYLSLTVFKNLESLNGIPSSVEYLQIRGFPKLNSLEGMRNCKTLKSAAIFGCDEVDDFNLLGEFKQLDSVYLEECSQLTNLDWAPQLPLVRLSATANKNLDNIDGIANHPTLKELKVTYGGKISNLDPIGTLLDLRELEVSVEHSDNIDFLTDLTKLERLEIQKFELADFTKLSKLKSLKQLDLVGCNVRSWEGIDQLTSLWEIRLINGSVESWDGLVAVPSLKRIDVFKNTIPQDHSPLKILQSLDSFAIESGKPNAQELEKLKVLLPNTKIKYRK